MLNDTDKRLGDARANYDFSELMSKVQILNSKNIRLAKEKFTGTTTINWYQGEPKDIETRIKRPIAEHS